MHLVFQRRMLVAKNMGDNIAEVCRYELCHNPSAMFDAAGLMRESNKPVPADSLWAIVASRKGTDWCSACNRRWLTSSTPALAKRINFQLYLSNVYSINNVLKNYKHPITVFDGYECGPSGQRSGGGQLWQLWSAMAVCACIRSQYCFHALNLPYSFLESCLPSEVRKIRKSPNFAWKHNMFRMFLQSPQLL